MANMTNKGALNFVLTTFGEQIPADVAEKLNGMIAQLEKKSGAERKPTSRQVENAQLKVQILELLVPERLYTATELMKMMGDEITVQRMTAILNQMVVAGDLDKIPDKHKTFFKLV